MCMWIWTRFCRVWNIFTTWATSIATLNLQMVTAPPYRAHEKVLMTRDVNGRFHLKLADFGFTTTGAPTRIYQSLEARKSTPYFAPEVILRHEFSQQSDIWAFGCILYEFLYCCFDRRTAFPSLAALASYHSSPEIPAPQIGWNALRTSPISVPASIIPYRPSIERSWELFNGVFRLTFIRDSDKRPDARTLRERKDSWAAGQPVDV